MNKLPVFTAAIAAFMLGTWTSLTYAATVNDVTDGSPYYYQAPAGTEVGVLTQIETQTDQRPGDLTPGDTDSGINHLPIYHGAMQTNETWRMVNVAEQVWTMIGDGKHALWRYQDNGTVRLYITDEAEQAGLGVLATRVTDEGFVLADLENPREAQQFAMKLSAAEIGDNYTHFDESAGFGTVFVSGEGDTGGGFKSFRGFNGDGSPGGGIVNANGHLTFLDVPIFHDFFGDTYKGHVPIDLAGYYCTHSAGGYPKAKALMDFAFAQPGAGHSNVGPLGKRAGLDIEENYTKIMRIHSFPDARGWINIKGNDDGLWRAIDTDRTLHEIYAVERPFFNVPFIFIVAVYDDNLVKGSHSYIRPDGPYFEHLKDRGLDKTFRTDIIEQPKFHTIKTTSSGKQTSGKREEIVGFRVYGLHHPGTEAVKSGSGCPSMGGDFGEDYYGAAWPTNYQEITPICDGFLLDIKFFANLDGEDWNDPGKNLANNTGSRNADGTTVPPGGLFKNIRIDVSAPVANPGHYGVFTDQYLIDNGFTSHEEFEAVNVGIPFIDPVFGRNLGGILHTIKFPSARDQVACNDDIDGDDIGDGVCPNSPQP